MSIDGRKLAKALVQKGFTPQPDRDHIWYHHQLSGKFTGVSTCLSHSRKEMRDIRGPLASKIKKQLRLDTPRQLDDMVNCPLTHELYVQHLRKKGLLPNG